MKLWFQMLMKMKLKSLLAEGANPLIISKNLAEIKSVKVSKKNLIFWCSVQIVLSR